jgi:hypothetical protein
MADTNTPGSAPQVPPEPRQQTQSSVPDPRQTVEPRQVLESIDDVRRAVEPRVAKFSEERVKKPNG